MRWTIADAWNNSIKHRPRSRIDRSIAFNGTQFRFVSPSTNKMNWRNAPFDANSELTTQFYLFYVPIQFPHLHFLLFHWFCNRFLLPQQPLNLFLGLEKKNTIGQTRSNGIEIENGFIYCVSIHTLDSLRACGPWCSAIRRSCNWCRSRFNVSNSRSRLAIAFFFSSKNKMRSFSILRICKEKKKQKPQCQCGSILYVYCHIVVSTCAP